MPVQNVHHGMGFFFPYYKNWGGITCLRSSRRKTTMPGFSLRPLLLCLAPASLPRVLPAPRGIHGAERSRKGRTPQSTGAFIFLVPGFTSTCWSALPSPSDPPAPRLADAAREPPAWASVPPGAVDGRDAAVAGAERKRRASCGLQLCGAEEDSCVARE